MARIRTVKPKFWDDSKLSKVSRDARLLFVGMWNFADDCGVLLGEPVWIKSKVFPYDIITPEQFQCWIKELLDISVIVPGTFREETFYHIKNFTRHQVINKPNNDDLYIPKDCISTSFNQSINDNVLITEHSGINTVSIRGGEERKGKEGKGKEGRGEEGSNQFLNGVAIYNAEEEILKNEIRFHEICSTTGNNFEDGKKSLHKYHLFLEEKEQYPKGKKAVFAGFEKWLLNEKKFNNGKQQLSGTDKSVGKTIEFDRP